MISQWLIQHSRRVPKQASVAVDGKEDKRVRPVPLNQQTEPDGRRVGTCDARGGAEAVSSDNGIREEREDDLRDSENEKEDEPVGEALDVNGRGENDGD